MVLEKKKFWIRRCISAISLLYPLGKGWGPSFEWTWIPFTKGCAFPCNVGWNWPSCVEEKYFKISSLKFCYFVIFSPLKKSEALRLTKRKFPLPNVLSLVEIGPVVVGKIFLNFRKIFSLFRKKYDNCTDRRMISGQQRIRKAHWSFQLRWVIKLSF